uniref:Uncharacterized protein n=1 Tax=Amphimedon queenslandica TaxID=400682 RepID=A0A1X7VWY6_AMPQE
MGVPLPGLEGPLYSDNAAVVQALESRSAKDPALVYLHCCLFFYLAHFEISYRAFHVAGKSNWAADALSRDRMPDFFSIFPQAPKIPSGIPQPLLDLLLDTNLSWTSKHWRALFRDSLFRV